MDETRAKAGCPFARSAGILDTTRTGACSPAAVSAWRSSSRLLPPDGYLCWEGGPRSVIVAAAPGLELPHGDQATGGCLAFF